MRFVAIKTCQHTSSVPLVTMPLLGLMTASIKQLSTALSDDSLGPYIRFGSIYTEVKFLYRKTLRSPPNLMDEIGTGPEGLV